MFNELHPQLFKLVFDYLTQLELLDFMIINRLFYWKLQEYLDSTKFIFIEYEKGIRYMSMNNLVISLKKTDFEHIDNQYNHIYWNFGLYGACESGNKNIIDYMIKKGAKDFEWAAIIAAENGHINIVEFMINKGAKDFNSILYFACFSGQIDIINLMINKGANDWDRSLSAACINGHKSIIDLMIQKGAKYCFNCGKHYNEHLIKVMNYNIDIK